MSFTEHHYENLVNQTEHLIEQTESFINDCRDVLAGFYDTDFHNSLYVPDQGVEQFFTRLRWRVKTGLINIAVTGEFASGKSFFISGLINQLKWHPKPNPRIPNSFDDAYDSLLPISPEQTTSCPLEIRPTISKNIQSWFEVTFSDDPKNWIQISLPSDVEDPEDELYKLLIGYVTSLEAAKFHRRKEHRDKQVAKARLHLSSMEIPAAIHDLPGLGGIDMGGQQQMYRQVFEDAMNGADCIFYLSSAERVLGDNELQMLRYIESIWRTKQVPIFFILTKVDKQSDADVNNVRSGNRKYFTTYFPSESDHTSPEFLGEGFIPISAAWEVKALGQYESDEIDLRISSERRDSLVKASGMPELRRKISDRLKIWTGPSNMRSIVIELGNLLLTVERELGSYLDAESEPINDINDILSQLKNEHRKIDAFKDELTKDLERRAVTCRKLAFKDALTYQLNDKLHTGLRPLIETLDVLKVSERHRIQREEVRLINEWLERPDGLYVQIAEILRRFREDTSIFFDTEADSQLKNTILKGRASLILEPYPVNFPKPSSNDNNGDIEGATNVIMSGIDVLRWVSTGVAGATGGSIAIVTTALSVATPALIILAPMSAGLFFWSFKKKNLEKDEYRRELLSRIPQTATTILEDIKERFDQQLLEPYIGQVLDLIEESSAENANKIRAYQKRLGGDLKPNVVRTEKLKDLLRRYDQLGKQINMFVRTSVD